MSARTFTRFARAIVFFLGAILMLTESSQAASFATHYRTVEVDGVQIFYREAGDPEAPTILLLHGFPTSSHMFRDIIPLLADRYHLVAPDYPGFGNSGRPTVGERLSGGSAYLDQFAGRR